MSVLFPLWAIGILGAIISIWALDSHLTTLGHLKYLVQAKDKSEFEKRNTIFNWIWRVYAAGDAMAKYHILQGVILISTIVFQARGLNTLIGWGLADPN